MVFVSICGNITEMPSGICTIMEEAGFGLGVFIKQIALSLPTLLIVLALVGLIIGIGGGLVILFKNAFSKHY